MSLEIKCTNFRCWDSNIFTFYQGINLLSGESGSGKSTICEAIYFTLYGTLKNISKSECIVVLTYQSNNISFRITRKKPNYLSVEIPNQIFHNQEAQIWIDNHFGSSDIWISTSYLSQGIRQFLLTSSNVEKVKLLNTFAFGESGQNNSPEFYINHLKSLDKNTSVKILQLQTQKRVYEGIANSIYEKNQSFFVYYNQGLSLDVQKTKIRGIIDQIEILQKNKVNVETMEKLQKKLLTIQEIEDPQNYIEKLIEERDYRISSKKLRDFDPRCLEITDQEMSDNSFYYSKYFDAGFDPKDNIISWLEIKKDMHQKYQSYKICLQENQEIKKRNLEKHKINQNFKQKYMKEKNAYLTFVQENNKYLHYQKVIFDYLNQAFNIKVNTISEATSFLNNSQEELFKNNFLFQKYLKAGWNGINLEDFLKSQKRLCQEYDQYLQDVETNKKIIYENSVLEKDYAYKHQEYVSKYNEYQKNLLKYQQYQKGLEEYHFLRSQIQETTLLISEENQEDDKSVYFAKELLMKTQKKLDQLFCPHCDNSLLYESGHLIKGFLSKEQHERYTLQCGLIEEEFKKRLHNYNLEKKIIFPEPFPEPLEPLSPLKPDYKPLIFLQNLSKPCIDCFEVPSMSYQMFKCFKNLNEMLNDARKYSELKHQSEPEEPVYLELENEKEIQNVTPSTLNIFEVPSLSFSDYLKIKNSQSLISEYHKFQSYKNEKINLSDQQLDMKIKNLKELQEKYHKNKEEKGKIDSQLEEVLQNLPTEYHTTTSIDISTKISQLNEECNVLQNTLQALKIFDEYNETFFKIQEYKKIIFSEMKNQERISKMIKIIDELGTRYLQEVIDDLNSSLKLILDELFHKPISVNLKTHRQLKNGDEKLEISFEISYNGMTYDSCRHLSGGEIDRISLALLLAFSKLKNSPIMILDEVSASLDANLREKVIEIIHKWTEGKIVINIAHESVQGFHDYVVSL